MLLTLPPPYLHQTRSTDETRRAWLQGARSICLVLPPGAGKTVTASYIAAGGLRKGRRVLWIAAREELVDQAAASLAKTGIKPGIVQAGRPSDPTSPIQVASQQTLVAMLKRGETLPPADIIIPDECHHVVARTWREILGQYPSVELVLGLTGTPERRDKTALGDVFQAIVAVTSVAELQKTMRPDGHPILVHMRAVGPSAYQAELWKTPLQAMQDHARDPRRPGRMRSTILFLGGVTEAHDTAALFVSYGIRAAAIDGTTNKRDRRRIVGDFKSGELDVLVNVDIATEGFDAPRCEVVGVARGCSAESTWLQMLMRGARSSPETGKVDGLVLDFRGQSYLHGPIQWDRKYSLHGKAIDHDAGDNGPSIRQCPACGSIFETGPDLCPDCGAALPRMKRRQARVKRSETVEITPDRITPMAKRKAEFDKLSAICVAKGYKPAWVGIQFKAKFGHWPSWPLPKGAAA